MRRDEFATKEELDSAQTLMDRIPPQNLEAEQSVLGSMMIDKKALARGCELLRKEAFYRDVHGVIFDSLNRLMRLDQPGDIYIVQEDLRNRSLLDSVGGTEYLCTLIDSVPTAANIEYYAGIVKQKWTARRQIDEYSRAIRRLFDGDNPHEVLAAVHLATLELEKADSKTEIVHVAEPLTTAYDAAEAREGQGNDVTGLPTGIPGLNWLTLGFQPSDQIIIAARPSHGKTATLLQSATYMAKAGHPVGIISLEMPNEQLALRLLSHSARVNNRALRSGTVGDTDPEGWTRLADHYGRLVGYPMYLTDEPDTNIRTLPLICRRMVSEFQVEAIFIDYLSLIVPEKAESREQEVGQMVRQIRATARRLKIPIITLHQLNRDVEKRGRDSKPTLSDLRESGQVEAHADVVIALWNPPSAEDPDGAEKRQAEFIVLKQRNGQTGTARTMWDGSVQTFYPIAQEPKNQRFPYSDD